MAIFMKVNKIILESNVHFCALKQIAFKKDQRVRSLKRASSITIPVHTYSEDSQKKL